MKLRRALMGFVAAVLPVVALATQVAAQPAQTGASVTYQVNARHDGNLIDSGVAAPPLTKKWSRDLGGNISYPIVADGRVFVTVAKPDVYGTVLRAFKADTGEDAWAPVDLGGTYWWSALAYGDGRLYAQNFDGVLSAFNPATGATIWSAQMPDQYAFTSPPTFANGVVYTAGAGSGGTVYAVDAATGAVLWTRGVANGDDSSPVVTANGVYVNYACEQTYAFEPKTGNPIWHHGSGCSGGGGKTAVAADGALWIRETFSGKPVILNIADGTVRGEYEAINLSPAPAFDGRQGYFVDEGILKERHSRTLENRWTFTGDGQLSAAPIVVNGYVYVGSRTGRLSALNGATGQEVWSTNVGAPILDPDEQNVARPLTGLGAGGGLVVAPATHTLVAYGH